MTTSNRSTAARQPADPLGLVGETDLGHRLCVHFRRAYVIPNMCMHPADPPHTFEAVGSMKATVVVRPYAAGEPRSWISGPQLIATVSIEANVGRRTNALFESLSRAEVPDGMASNDFVDHRGQITLAGPAVMIAPGRVPGFLDQALAPIEAALEESAARVTGLLRWRCNVSGPIGVPHLNDHEWSLDGVAWHLDCRRSPFPVTLMGPDLVMNDARRADLMNMISQDADEPLHQSLLREAASLRTSNPRSALAIGVTAAETAVKWLVARVVPDASWLIHNLPSPPIAKIVEEYLPDLPHATPMKFAPEVIKGLKIAVTARNDLVHGKGTSRDDDTMDRAFAAIRDVVWLCDYFGGVGWAVNRVRPATLAAMGLSPTVPNSGWFVD